MVMHLVPPPKNFLFCICTILSTLRNISSAPSRCWLLLTPLFLSKKKMTLLKEKLRKAARSVGKEYYRHQTQMRRAFVPSIPSDIPLHACGIVSSTMDIAKSMLREGNHALPFGVMAESQTAGRGHGERSWVSERGNLLVSFVIPSSYASISLSTLLPIMTVVALRHP